MPPTPKQQGALKALHALFLMSPGQKRVWATRVLTFGDDECDRFLSLLREEPESILESLEQALDQVLMAGDQEKIQQFERLLTQIKREALTAEEHHTERKDSARLSILNEDLNQL